MSTNSHEIPQYNSTKYQSPNSSHKELEISWNNNITSIQYDQKHTILVQLP